MFDARPAQVLRAIYRQQQTGELSNHECQHIGFESWADNYIRSVKISPNAPNHLLLYQRINELVQQVCCMGNTTPILKKLSLS